MYEVILRILYLLSIQDSSCQLRNGEIIHQMETRGTHFEILALTGNASLERSS